MPSVLLDTHILVWWRVEPQRLTPAQASILSDLDANRPASISAITLWELAKMAERKVLEVKLPLDVWIQEIALHPLVEVLPLNARIAAESVQLGAGFPKDPADQIIVATARCLGIPLMSADQRIRQWGKVALI